MKIIFSLVIIILLLLVLLKYIGFFSEIKIKEKEMGPYILVYKDHKGNYKETAKIQNEIYYSLLNPHNIKTLKGFGIYYDNPKEVPKNELRSIAGCILEKDDYSKKDYLIENGYNIKEINSQKSIVVEFPYKNNLSVFVGVMKVYPKIEKYIKENNLESSEIMEIYDIPEGMITYLMKI